MSESKKYRIVPLQELMEDEPIMRAMAPRIMGIFPELRPGSAVQIHVEKAEGKPKAAERLWVVLSHIDGVKCRGTVTPSSAKCIPAQRGAHHGVVPDMPIEFERRHILNVLLEGAGRVG